MTPIIRDMAATHLPAVNAIYNHYVLTSTCTYQETPSTADERMRWWEDRSARFPLLVLEHEHAVVGFASLSAYRPRSGYRFSVEDSIYLAAGLHGRGWGKMLLAELLRRARTAGFHSVIAGAEATQTASIKLHHALGFVEVGRMREVGFKFGRWLDTIYLQKML